MVSTAGDLFGKSMWLCCDACFQKIPADIQIDKFLVQQIHQPARCGHHHMYTSVYKTNIKPVTNFKLCFKVARWWPMNIYGGWPSKVAWVPDLSHHTPFQWRHVVWEVWNQGYIRSCSILTRHYSKWQLEPCSHTLLEEVVAYWQLEVRRICSQVHDSPGHIFWPWTCKW